MEKCFLFLLMVYLLFSCNIEPKTAGSLLHIYTKLLSRDGDGVRCQVKVIGYDGNAISGAVVTALNPAKKTLELNYEEGDYRGIFETPLSGEYYIFIKAVSDGEVQRIEKTISHVAITEKPKIETLADASGTSALTGGSLDGDLDITVGWNKVKSTVYCLTVNYDGFPVYSVNSKNAFGTIPAGTLSPNKNYSVSVTAQYLEGDPFLLDQDFASQSLYSGSSVFFRTAQ